MSEESVEQVLVVPTGDLEDAGMLHAGFRAVSHEAVTAVVARAGRFIARPLAEEDPGFKQIIPYAVVAHGRRVLLLRRSRQGQETRLHDRLSLGVGGHINPGSASRERWIRAGLERELHEELHFSTDYRATPLGTINDDSNDVGRVHFGLVFLVRVATSDVAVRETELLHGSFVGLPELTRLRDSMETWSSFLCEALRERPQLLEADAGLEVIR